jgi:hypothetical protein
MKRTKSWRLAVLGMGSAMLTCYAPDSSQVVADTTTADTTAAKDTHGVETGTSTSSESNGGPIDTGGCMPGVFGESRFGEACFQ